MTKFSDIWYFVKNLFRSGPKTMIVKVTAYGWLDNDPPGHAIAYPALNGHSSIHYYAGGTGSFIDPITFAADPRVFKRGTMIYIPRLKKYFIMEDLCHAATLRKPDEPPIVDIWVGGAKKSDLDKLTQAEEDLTRERETIVVNPTNAFSWDPKPLYED